MTVNGRSARLLGPPWVPQMQYLECKKFLCDDNGHLLPHFRQVICKKVNHWGHPHLSAWDENFECCCNRPRRAKKCRRRNVLYNIEDIPRFYKCREPLAECIGATCSILDNKEVTAALEEDFQKIRCKAPPVVWVLGHPHKNIACKRKCFTRKLASKLGFVHIDMEEMLEGLAVKYLGYCPCSHHANAQASCGQEKSGQELLPDDLNESPINIRRMVMLLKNVLFHTDYTEAFNTTGILEILKMAFLSHPEATGFVVDEFPVNLTEAEGYECMFWPAACGVYFVSEKWVKGKNKACSGRVIIPEFFARSDEYLESFVDTTASEFGYKIVKVPGAEHIDDADALLIEAVIADLIFQYNGVIYGNYFSVGGCGCLKDQGKGNPDMSLDGNAGSHPSQSVSFLGDESSSRDLGENDSESQHKHSNGNGSRKSRDTGKNLSGRGGKSLTNLGSKGTSPVKRKSQSARNLGPGWVPGGRNLKIYKPTPTKQTIRVGLVTVETNEQPRLEPISITSLAFDYAEDDEDLGANEDGGRTRDEPAVRSPITQSQEEFWSMVNVNGSMENNEAVEPEVGRTVSAQSNPPRPARSGGEEEYLDEEGGRGSGSDTEGWSRAATSSEISESAPKRSVSLPQMPIEGDEDEIQESDEFGW